MQNVMLNWKQFVVVESCPGLLSYPCERVWNVVNYWVMFFCLTGLVAAYTNYINSVLKFAEFETQTVIHRGKNRKRMHAHNHIDGDEHWARLCHRTV